MAKRGHGHRHGRYGNPPDLDRMIRRQLAPERPRWQKPDAVIRALRLPRGATVADVGAGPGFFTERLARAVGRRGHVFAVDPEPAVLDVLRERLARTRLRNVTPVLSRGNDPMLPPRSCDLALIVNVYHHFEDRPAFLRRVAACLKPGGRIAAVEWAPHETPVGPPVDRRISPGQFAREAGRAGLVVVQDHKFLPHQYFLVLERRR